MCTQAYLDSLALTESGSSRSGSPLPGMRSGSAPPCSANTTEVSEAMSTEEDTREKRPAISPAGMEPAMKKSTERPRSPAGVYSTAVTPPQLRAVTGSFQRSSSPLQKKMHTFAPISQEDLGSAASPPLPIATPSAQELERIIAQFTAEKNEAMKFQFLALKKAKNEYFKRLENDEDIPFDLLTRAGLERLCQESNAPLVWEDFILLHGPPERCNDAQAPIIEKRQCVQFLMSLEMDELQHCPLRDIFSTLSRNMPDSVREAFSGAGYTTARLGKSIPTKKRSQRSTRK